MTLFTYKVNQCPLCYITSPYKYISFILSFLTLTNNNKKLPSTEACQITFSQHVYSITLKYEMCFCLLPYLYT